MSLVKGVVASARRRRFENTIFNYDNNEIIYSQLAKYKIISPQYIDTIMLSHTFHLAEVALPILFILPSVT